MQGRFFMEKNNVVDGNAMETGINKTLTDKKGIQAYTRYGMGLLVYLLSMLVLPSAIMLLLGLFMSAEVLVSYAILVNYLCMYLVGFPLLLLIMRKVPKIKPIASEPKKLKVWQVIGLFFIGYAIMNGAGIIVGIIESLLGTNATITVSDLSTTNPIVLFVSGVIIAPIMEEIIFRKIGYEKVASYGGGLYIVYTAILFGLVHMNLGQSIYAMLIGFMLAKITYETGTIKYAMIIHVLCNFFGGTGIGSLIIRMNNDFALNIYAVFIYIFIAIGIICMIIFFVKYRGVLKNTPAVTPMSNKKRAFLNPGTILFILITLVVISALFFVK